MIQLENINEHGLKYIGMAIIEMLINDCHMPRPKDGMFIGCTYLTPETCYWLFKLLQECPNLHAKDYAMEILSNATNNPETLKKDIL